MSSSVVRRAGTLLAYMGAALALASASDVPWLSYGNDAGGTRYSPVSLINRSTVSRLAVAWTFRTGALDRATDLNGKAAFESTPLMVDGTLYLSTPYDHVFALDPQTGTKRWEYDAALDLSHGYSEVTSRGVAAWRDPTLPRGGRCALRIFLGTLDGRLIAIDGANGTPCAGFGDGGAVDLTHDVGLRDTGDYQVTSAPSVIGDAVIVGSSIGDNRAVTLERGIVRAFDARTGRQRWAWDPIPWGRQTNPPTGAGNAWSTMSVDEQHDLVFVPTGSASPDFYGGLRKGDNKWANSVVALRASTGALVWGFQVVHHDLWDYDVAAQPTLFAGKGGIPAIAIATKMGRVFVLNRLTGQPLLPVEERPVPASDVPGEEASPTQPGSTISLVPETVSVADAFGPTPEERAWCADRLKAARTGPMFTPPSLQGTVLFPGNVGGVNWGSAAYDPRRHLLFANTNRLPYLVKLIPRDEFAAARRSASREDRLHGEFAPQTGAPYAMFRTPLLSPQRGVPCNPPPWGTLAAVDLFTARIAWNVPLGGDIPNIPGSSINLGGPMATSGGLVFTAASIDRHLRAFDSDTGQELWAYELPAGGQSTPMTYAFRGTQYVVIAAGGHGKMGTKQGDYVMAFALR